MLEIHLGAEVGLTKIWGEKHEEALKNTKRKIKGHFSIFFTCSSRVPADPLLLPIFHRIFFKSSRFRRFKSRMNSKFKGVGRFNLVSIK